MNYIKLLSCILGGIFQGVAAALIIKTQIKKQPMKKIILTTLVLCIFGFISLFFISNQLRFVITLIFFSLVIYFILNIKDKKVILYAFNAELILAINELFVTISLVLIGINSDALVNNYKYNLITNILVSIISIIIIKIKLVKKLLFKINNLFTKNQKLINYLYIFLFILYLIVSKNGLELIFQSNYYINILFLVVAIIIITIFVKNEYRYEQINLENRQMLNYVTKYEKIITDQGKANHEFKNQLMVIRGYAQMNSPKLNEYLDSIIEDIRKTQSSYLISQLNKFPDGGIKGLLYYKLSIMEDYNIKYEINVDNGVKNKLNSLNTNTYKNITNILGVLLDNAIDAAKISSKKKVIISVNKEKKCVVFSLYNSYKGKIDTSKIGTGYTTKGKGHGYGLRLVKDIISKNKILKIDYELDQKYFISKLIINNKK